MSTSVWCWTCCHPFETIPVAIPHIYDSKRNIFFCYGNFCSFSCAKRYVLESSGNTQSCTLLALLRSKIIGGLGTTNIGIKAAPPRASLKVFGGKLSIESFREGLEFLLPQNMLFPNQDVSMERVQRPGTMQWLGELGSDSKARISKTMPYSGPHVLVESTGSDPVLEAALEKKAMRAIQGSQPVKNNAYKLSRAKPLHNTGDLFSVLNMDIDGDDDEDC